MSSESKKIRECMVCFTNENDVKMRVFLCGHFACEECTSRHLTERITSNLSVSCIEGKECKQIPNKWEFEDILSNEILVTYEKNLLEEFLNTQNLVQCPNPRKGGCKSRIMVENEDATFMKCSECNFKFCIQCKSEWHSETTCEKYQAWREENKMGDTLIINFIKKAGAKRCPKCKNWIEKNQGCDHMTCVKCKHEFLWTTGKNYLYGYKEFDDSNVKSDFPEYKSSQNISEDMLNLNLEIPVARSPLPTHIEIKETVNFQFDIRDKLDELFATLTEENKERWLSGKFKPKAKNLSNLSIDRLKKMCKEKELKSTGNKEELIRRLSQFN